MADRDREGREENAIAICLTGLGKEYILWVYVNTESMKLRQEALRFTIHWAYLKQLLTQGHDETLEI